MQNVISAISESDPAYAFYFTEMLAAAAAVDLGLNRSTANIIARETMVGAGMQLAHTTDNLGNLRRSVTSPNCTTQQAITVFDQHDLKNVLLLEARAATERAVEIANESQL